MRPFLNPTAVGHVHEGTTVIQTWTRKALASATAFCIGVALAIASAASASAYQPSPSNLYVANNTAACSKQPCVLHPKPVQLPGGRIVAGFEDSESAPVGQTTPVYKSDDDGTTWSKLTDVKAPAYLSSDPQYAKSVRFGARLVPAR
jgi:hypothetical protein